MTDELTVRRIRVGEWEALRRVRLAALADAPYAFARTHEEESLFPDAEWQQRADGWAAGPEGATFFAELDDAVVGLVGGHRRNGDDVVELVSMWASPVARGAGVGSALVEAVMRWAEGDTVELWVTRGNDPAIRLYERCGFEITGDHQPLPSDPCKDEVRMRRLPN